MHWHQGCHSTRHAFTSGCHVEDDGAFPEDGRDDGDVGEVGAACQLRVVGHQHIALLDALLLAGALVPVLELQAL